MINREMNKKERQLSADETKKLLLQSTEGTLAVNGDDGYPYCLPMNYVYLNDAIYIHAADRGYKIDALKENKKVCFSVIASSSILPELFTTGYESVIAAGDAEFVDDPAEKQMVMEAFVSRFSPGFEEGGMKFIKAAIHRTAVIKINILDVKGKSFRSPAK